ncbi:hypothetical protein BDB01DRAFT_744468, partial [Pilobolus umbonatus]
MKSVPTDDDQIDNLTSYELQPWVIGVVVVACLSVVGACLAIFCAIGYSRRRKSVHGEKDHIDINSIETSSIFPHTAERNAENRSSMLSKSIASYQQPSIRSHRRTASFDESHANKMYGVMRSNSGKESMHTGPHNHVHLSSSSTNHKQGFVSTSSLPLNDIYMTKTESTRPHSTASFSNMSSRSDPPLSSTDALLIADTFRQKMRRPEWQQNADSQKTESRAEEEREEEEKRRQLSEELLKTELEAEGTLMKKVAK